MKYKITAKPFSIYCEYHLWKKETVDFLFWEVPRWTRVDYTTERSTMKKWKAEYEII